METEEAKQARTVRVAAALEKYKQQAGLIVDPVIEAKAQEAFDAATVFFEAGALTAALEKYSESADLVWKCQSLWDWQERLKSSFANSARGGY